VALSIAGLLAFSSARVPAQTKDQSGVTVEDFPSQLTSAPTIKVYTRETLVDVTVTDAKGKPVHGLTRSNFTVTEDDKPLSIRSFQEFTSTKPATVATAPKLPPNTYTNHETATGPLNVLLFDDVNGGDKVQARWAAASFIKKMAPGTEVALLALGDRLTVLQGPTTDPALLLKVVNIPVKPYTIESIGAVDPCGAPIARNRATLEQLNQVATYLSGIKGKKNMIWISNGIAGMVWGACQEMRLQLQQTYDLLEDAQVTIYPLDPSGVRDLGRDQLAMEAVAEATGGVAYYERNDLDTLMFEAVDAGASYYTLSYTPPSIEYDGRYHAINIKVDRPDLHLLYRKGYSSEDPTLIEHPPETLFGFVTRDTRPTGPAADPLVAALSPIAPPATQLLFDVRVEPSTEPPNPFDPPVIGQLNPKLRTAPLTRYSLLYALPQSQIAFADAGGGTYSGSVEFDVAAFDTDGKLVTIFSQTQKLPLTNEEYGEFIAAPFQFFQQIDLPPGQLTLRVGVFDGVSNKFGTLEIPLTVGKGSPAQKPDAAKSTADETSRP
jgi:VWFA-related protein